MLKQKSRELTWKILAKLNVKETSAAFCEINPCILKCLENVYLKARNDQLNKLAFTYLEDGSIHFPDE